VYVSEIDKEKAVSYDLGFGRQIYMVQIEGESALNGDMKLGMRDGLEIVGPGRVEVVAKAEKSHILFIEMATM
jgi:quercetin 2,3-dioxygenase